MLLTTSKLAIKHIVALSDPLDRARGESEAYVFALRASDHYQFDEVARFGAADEEVAVFFATQLVKRGIVSSTRGVAKYVH